MFSRSQTNTDHSYLFIPKFDLETIGYIPKGIVEFEVLRTHDTNVCVLFLRVDQAPPISFSKCNYPKFELLKMVNSLN